MFFLDGTHVPRTQEQGDKYYIIGVALGLLLCVGCLTVIGYHWLRYVTLCAFLRNGSVNGKNHLYIFCTPTLVCVNTY